MISKGKFRYLRDKYRGIVMMNRFIANIAWQWEADSINGRTYTPEAIQKAVKDFERNIGAKWEQVKNSWVADDCFHVVIEKPKGPASLTFQRGKHKQFPKDGVPGFTIYRVDNLQGQARPLTPEEIEDQKKFTDYVSTLGELKLEDTVSKRLELCPKQVFKSIAQFWGHLYGKQDQPTPATVPHIAVVDTRSR